MCEYNRVIFLCKENLNQSPMAEWIFKSIIMDTEKQIESRGLVVLFPEPLNSKVSACLRVHSVPCKEETSKALEKEDFTEDTLFVTMNSVEKIKIAEEFGVTENVFTLKEFVDEEGDVFDPYGEEEEGYETLYLELKDLLYKMKSKLSWK